MEQQAKNTRMVYEADEGTLTVSIRAGGQEVYRVNCINRVHFYTVRYAAQKVQEGEPPHDDLFRQL